jgi:hypothetical protein
MYLVDSDWHDSSQVMHGTAVDIIYFISVNQLLY